MVDKATTKKKAKKKAGRPKGSKTKEKPTVFVHPAGCPSCASTLNHVRRGHSPTIKEIHGVLAGGIRFTSVEWRSKVCDGCGQNFRERVYQFDPAKWK